MVMITDRHASELMTLCDVVRVSEEIANRKQLKIPELGVLASGAAFVRAVINRSLDSKGRDSISRRARRNAHVLMPIGFPAQPVEDQICLLSCIVHEFLQCGWRPDRYPNDAGRFIEDLLKARVSLLPRVRPESFPEGVLDSIITKAKAERIFIV
jgi:hypothetical protein